MTPFQAIKATFYMLLAKAREPIEERELAPASPGAPRPTSATARSGSRPLKMAQTGRRKTDSLVRHRSLGERIWTAVVKWATRPNTGAKV